jgi:hypothetical protein
MLEADRPWGPFSLMAYLAEVRPVLYYLLNDHRPHLFPHSLAQRRTLCITRPNSWPHKPRPLT